MKVDTNVRSSTGKLPGASRGGDAIHQSESSRYCMPIFNFSTMGPFDRVFWAGAVADDCTADADVAALAAPSAPTGRPGAQTSAAFKPTAMILSKISSRFSKAPNISGWKYEMKSTHDFQQNIRLALTTVVLSISGSISSF